MRHEKLWITGLGPPPMNAGQVWEAVLNATLGICDQLFQLNISCKLKTDWKVTRPYVWHINQVAIGHPSSFSMFLTQNQLINWSSAARKVVFDPMYCTSIKLQYVINSKSTVICYLSICACHHGRLIIIWQVLNSGHVKNSSLQLPALWPLTHHVTCFNTALIISCKKLSFTPNMVH